MDGTRKNDIDKKSKKATLKKSAYHLIKDAILNKQFIVGNAYSQKNIMQELEISKTPLREALIELQKDGYVAFHRGTGVLIKALSEREAAEIIEFRIGLESYSARLAAERATKEDLNNIQKALQQLKLKMSTKDEHILVGIDHDFHIAVAVASHNDFLRKQCESSWDQVLRFASMSTYKNSIDNNHVLKEHQAVYDAIAAHNSTKAEKAMEKHLNMRRLLPKMAHSK